MKKTLSPIRINENVNAKIEAALKKHNKENMFKISLQEFRKMSYVVFADIILQGKEKEFLEVE